MAIRQVLIAEGRRNSGRGALAAGHDDDEGGCEWEEVVELGFENSNQSGWLWGGGIWRKKRVAETQLATEVSFRIHAIACMDGSR
jgi:hypothetical protein